MCMSAQNRAGERAKEVTQNRQRPAAENEGDIDRDSRDLHLTKASVDNTSSEDQQSIGPQSDKGGVDHHVSRRGDAGEASPPLVDSEEAITNQCVPETSLP
ncbi:unnamed protein product, partial [Dibothriocephalus latus]